MVILKNTVRSIDIAGPEDLEGARKSSTSHLRGPTDRSRPRTRESNDKVEDLYIHALGAALNVPAQSKQFLKGGFEVEAPSEKKHSVFHKFFGS